MNRVLLAVASVALLGLAPMASAQNGNPGSATKATSKPDPCKPGDPGRSSVPNGRMSVTSSTAGEHSAANTPSSSAPARAETDHGVSGTSGSSASGNAPGAKTTRSANAC